MKKILITGARSGIIGNTVDKLIGRYYIYLSVHTSSQLKYVREKYKNIPNVECLKLDITNKDDVLKVNDLDIDIYIANAAIGESGSIADIPIDKVRNNFEVNVFSNINLLQVILKKMINKGHGKIVVIGSLAGRMPLPFLGVYASTKASLISMMESLKLELYLLKSDIKLSLIMPGLYETGFNKLIMDKKYDYMDIDSFFKSQIEYIRKYDSLYLKLFEMKKLSSITEKIVKAIDSDNPKFIYSAPFYQYFTSKIINLFI